MAPLNTMQISRRFCGLVSSCKGCGLDEVKFSMSLLLFGSGRAKAFPTVEFMSKE
jgi:hypothetical protein